jgi:DNA-binding response OmpR family regulator
MLPVLNGFQVLEVLRSRFPNLLRRTVVISAASTKVLQDIQPYEAELACVIRKPFDIAELREAVRACGGKSQDAGLDRDQAASKNSHAS